MAGTSNRIPVLAQMHGIVAEQFGIPRRGFFANPEIMVPAIQAADACRVS